MLSVSCGNSELTSKDGMPYRYLEEEATADVAFEAWGTELAEVFSSAAEALTSIMIRNPESIEPRDTRVIRMDGDHLDLLLLNFIEQFIYFKDTGQFLTTRPWVRISKNGDQWVLNASARGEALDGQRHHQVVDVKAVTLHNLSLVREDGGWRAHVVLDI
jgi:SHS2 domain-containing protein